MKKSHVIVHLNRLHLRLRNSGVQINLIQILVNTRALLMTVSRYFSMFLQLSLILLGLISSVSNFQIIITSFLLI